MDSSVITKHIFPIFLNCAVWVRHTVYLCWAMQAAQFNIGKLIGDLHDPGLDNYIAAAEVVNKVVERTNGFAWKYET